MAEIIKHSQHLSLGMGTTAAFAIGTGGVPHTTLAPEDKAAGSKIAKWGDTNLFPQEYMAVQRKNGAASSSYRFNKAAHYAQGFKLWRADPSDDGKGNRMIVPVSSLPEVSAFFRQNKMFRVWTEVIADLELWSWGTPEFILSNDFSKIVSVRRQQTAKCRYEKINSKTGLIENIYFCHAWAASTPVDSPYVNRIPVVDSYSSAEQVREYCKSKKIHKFIMPLFYPLVDETYYPEPEHHSVYRNKWMEVVNAIPEYKKHFSENQLNVKYMVYISEEYFLRTYGEEWQKFNTDKKNEIRTALTDAIDSHLAGNANAGKSIQATVFKDANGNWIKGIEVVPLKDENSSEGKGLLDSSAGNSEIMSAWGVDPNLMGVGIPGGKLNGGSGSDKREAFSIINSLFKSKREITLEIWRLIRDYNGWDVSLEGDFAFTELTTLDKNPTGTETKI